MVSIIIPVYNCEAYIDRCICSVLAQTYHQIELILIDDGSKDNSGAICDAWAAKDSRVKVLHQENAGVSAARNAGLDAATGEYIGFVDADDWVEPQMVEQLLEAARSSDADMVLFDPVVHVEATGQTHVDSMLFFPQSIALSKDQITPEKLRFIAGTIWRFLYKKELLQIHKLRFDTRLPLSEDRLFNICALGCSKKVYYLRVPFYHYWINAASATSKYRPDMLQIVLDTQALTEEALLRYWGREYIPIYEKVNVVDGAVLCVNNAFSPQIRLPFASRYRQVRQVLHNERIQSAMQTHKIKSVRQWMVKHRCSLMLCAVAMLWQAKHKKR